MTTTSLPSWNFLCTIKYLALCQYPAGLTRTISLQSFKIVAVLYKFKLIGRRERPWARIIHRSSPLPLPCSVSDSESGAKRAAEGSENSLRLSPCFFPAPSPLRRPARRFGQRVRKKFRESSPALRCYVCAFGTAP